MTLKCLFFYSFVQWLALLLLKIWFFNNAVLANPGWQSILLWLLAAVVSTAVVRRFGIINYLEAIFIIIAWVLGDLFLDLVVTTRYVGMEIFSRIDFWAIYFILALAVFLLHKKRHVQVRKLLQHSHHGHH